MPPNNATWYQSVIAGLTTEAQNTIGQAQLFNSSTMVYGGLVGVRNAYMQYTKDIAALLVNDYLTRINEINEDYVNDGHVRAILAELIRPVSDTINNLNNQLNREITELRTPGRGGAAKMNLPENFSGTDGKIGYDKWIRKMELYFAYSNIIADRARLLIALSRLTGTPSIQFKDLAEQVTNDQVRYTWTEFKRRLSGVYG
ncbi:hypothetical protein K435DRAFT_880448 [Dendrothele bispora CBS 962.96]|uniref:Uncharacterized protein n=1 Tax=Dendrothele bispora (strain CBS 962.96) TaxID=1314807 RepID=A0A4S8KJL0_DENBC|nr:hypothetical protein K435DRAFT_880448 [Dendrothele bispora CBS 962.96]